MKNENLPENFLCDSLPPVSGYVIPNIAIFEIYPSNG